MSIRVRLLLLVLFATLLPTLLTVHNFIDQRRARVASAQSALSALAQRAGQELDERINGTRQLLYGLARASDLDTADRTACSAFLANVREAHPQFTGMLTINPDGRLFCDSLGTGRQLDLNDRRYFQEARATHDRVALQPAFGRLTGLSVLQIAYPARREDGALKFVLLASINLEAFARGRSRSALVPDNDFFIFDRDGTVLVAHPRERPVVPVGTSIAGTALHRFATSGTRGETGEGIGLDRQRRVWGLGASSDPGAGLYVVAAVPKQRLLAAADAALYKDVTIVALFSLLVFLGGWLLAELGVRRPLGRVIAMVNRLSTGDLAARVGLPRPRGEVGELAEALDRTAASLETHARRAEALNARLGALIRSSPAAIMCLDPASRVTLWNPAAEKLFGYAAADVMGKRPPTIPEEKWPHFERAHRRVLAGGTEDGEIVCEARDGRRLSVLYRIAPLSGEDGAIVESIVAFTDMTEMQALEARLRQSQKLEAVGQLTGGLAHDFNNLLTVILGNSEILAERLADDARLRAVAETTHRAAIRGSELTHSLLAFARRQALEPKIVDVNALMSDMQGLLHRTLGEHIDIRLSAGKDLWPTLVDPAQLETAVLNLAINARDAMPEGGQLTIETGNVVLDEGYAGEHVEVRAGEYVMVAVADSGNGMPPEIAARAFEPFFTTKEVGRGSGLGLSMVYGFVKQSGGHVKIYTELGLGTMVKLYLPRAAGIVMADPAAARRTAAQGGGEIVLIVEDDEMVREYVETQIASLGYRVITARDGSEALATLRSDAKIDLLFTDVVMPGGINGRQLAQEAQLLRPGLRVLYTSGYTENVILHHGRLDSGVLLLNKPYTRAELAAKLRLALRGEP